MEHSFQRGIFFVCLDKGGPVPGFFCITKILQDEFKREAALEELV